MLFNLTVIIVCCYGGMNAKKGLDLYFPKSHLLFRTLLIIQCTAAARAIIANLLRIS